MSYDKHVADVTAEIMAAPMGGLIASSPAHISLELRDLVDRMASGVAHVRVMEDEVRA